ncbi:MAG: ATP-binding protein [Patescibacteria group bacterium]|nr:ATP-binding protein [Patescibacteria group bacterium]
MKLANLFSKQRINKLDVKSEVIIDPITETLIKREDSEKEDKEKIIHGEKPEYKDIVKAVFEDNVPIVDVIATNEIEIDFDHIKIGDVYIRSLFISGYPRFVSPGWLEQLVNFNSSLDISFFIYPVKGKEILNDLMRKIAEMEAELATDLERGKVVNPSTEAKLEDARRLQQELVKGIEHFYEFSFYVTVRATGLEQLNQISKQVESTLGSVMVTAKHATLDMENGFLSTMPFGMDRLSITRNMDTTSLATMFPLTSAELSSDKGILYGINSQNGSFIVFDRFSLENSNMVIFGSSGGGKSYFVKLEALRSLMLGTEIIIIDPENEYKTLCDAVGGQYLSFSFNSDAKINPFDLSYIKEEGENQLGLKILSLHSLFKIIMGEITPSQEALLDRALVATYKSKGITQDPATQTKEPPLMEDLYKILIGMEIPEALDLAARIEKFVKGSYVGIFDQQTTFDITNPFTVFSVRELQDQLRPIAMFIILDFIWTRVKKDLKPRILIVDEAWHMMRYADSAQFLWSIVKRARKYYLGITTITQDVEDFLSQDIGKAVVTNAALRVLFKQSPAAIDKITQVFYLSQGERQLLLGSNIGQGIFFAGNNHAPISVVASPEEHKLITTKPQELMQRNLEYQTKKETEVEKQENKINIDSVIRAI